MKRQIKILAAALAAAGLLAACGGGGGSGGYQPAQFQVTKVKVAGDSLSDSGTFGFKYTVQGADAAGKPFQLWAERVAAQYKVDLCAHYQSTSQDMTGYTEKATCGNYAVAGAEINPLDQSGAPIKNPRSVIHQIQHLAEEGISSNDLLLVAAGSNDAAGLIENFLVAAATSDQAPLMRQLLSRIDATTLNALVAKNQQGLIEAGGLYMQKVAEQLAAAIKTDLLGKGAQHVAMLNVPAITMTPQFAKVLKDIEQAQGTTQAEVMKQVFDGWVKAFNSTLAQSFKDEARVAVVDFYQSFTDMVQSPGKYDFSNVTVPACSVLGVTTDIYNCQAARLTTTIPQGETRGDWWATYMFSNAFHPTPLAHAKMSELMTKALADKGWQP